MNRLIAGVLSVEGKYVPDNMVSSVIFVKNGNIELVILESPCSNIAKQ